MESDERRSPTDPKPAVAEDDGAGPPADAAGPDAGDAGAKQASADREATASSSDDAPADGTATKNSTSERLDQAAAESPDRPDGGERAAPARRGPAPAGPPPTEAEIDSPDRRTLLLFGVIFIVTTASWGAAKLSCNYHPPQSRPPPELRTDQLARTPKDAAIEFVFRRSTRNYQGALELATASLAQELEREGATCEEQGAACINERSRLEKTLVTTAVVTSLDGDQAVATVTNQLPSGEERYELRLKKDGLVWKSTAQKKL